MKLTEQNAPCVSLFSLFRLGIAKQFPMTLRKSGGIYKKLIISSFITSFIPFFLMVVIALPIYSRHLYLNTSTAHLEAIEQSGEMINGLVEQIVFYSNIFFTNNDINHVLRRRTLPTTYEALSEARVISNVFTSNTYIFGELRYFVYIIGENGRSFSSVPREGTLSIDDLRNEPWYENLRYHGGRIEWISNIDAFPLQHIGTDAGFAAARPVLHPFTGDVLGVCLIIPHEITLRRIYDNASNQFSHFYILDPDGHTIFSGADSDMSFDTELFRREIAPYQSGFFQAEMGGVDSLVVFSTMGVTNWKVVGTVDLADIYAPINSLVFLVILLFGAFIISVVILSLIIHKRISEPIRQLDQKMRAVSLDNLDIQSQIAGEDEVGNLAKSFDDMTARMKNLLADYEQEHKQKRLAELRALQSNIKPHFLYNTLASIRFMLTTHNNDEIDRVIQALVRLLKHTISTEEENHSVRDEFELIKEYILIMQARNANRFTVEFQLEPEASNLEMIKLLLQPIVENSIYHGFRYIDHGGILHVKACTEYDSLFLTVTDNGAGMTPDEFLKIDSGRTGGIKNVSNRITLNFGAGYGLTIKSLETGGLRTILRLPIIRKDFERSKSE